MFEAYSRYYDDLYKEKDYQGEVDFVVSLFENYSANKVTKILDFGCGTGGHAFHLARNNFHITGVDRSPMMIEQAIRKSNQTSEIIDHLKFIVGDIREIDLNQKFDAVISMFAVISYQIENRDLLHTFRTARRHLEPGSLFIFDAWYGPAVLNIKPQDRYRIIEKSGDERIIRFVHPQVESNGNVVFVNYHIINISGEKILNEVIEQHPMRYLFLPEVEILADITGFEVCLFCPISQSNTKLTDNDWNFISVLRAM